MDDQATASDVLIIGAGAAGLLAALELRRLGYSVTLVDSGGVAVEQSNHSHGYLHRGYIYQAPSAALVRELNRGADSWLALLGSAGLQPACEHSMVGFANRYNAVRTAKRWSESGLPVNMVEAPASIVPGRLRAVFATPEPAFDFTDWYARAARELSATVRFVQGEVTKILVVGHRVEGVQIHVGRSPLTVRANSYVATAGTGNIDLVKSVMTLRGRGVNRTSLMLVVQGDLAALNLIVPDNDSYGLFMVSRRRDSKTVWLVSNYLSFAHHMVGTLAASFWLRATASTLHYLTGFLDEEISWGVYVAAKGELRSDPRSLSEHSLETYGYDNLVVGSPSKLTLAPLLAKDIARHIEARLSPTGDSAVTLPTSNPHVAPERWTLARMYPGGTLRRFVTDPRWDTDSAFGPRDVVTRGPHLQPWNPSGNKSA